MNRATANLLLLCSGLIWGGAFITQSTAMEYLGPLQFSGLRFLMAGFALLPLVFRENKKRAATPMQPRHWRDMFIVGSFFLGGTLAQQYGILYTSITNAGFLTAVYVVLIPLICLFLLREPPHVLAWPASLLTLSGVYLLGEGSISTLNFGDLLMLAGAVCWALQVIFVGRVAIETQRPFTLATIQFLFVGIAATFASFFYESYSFEAIKAATFELFFAGIMSGCVAFTLQAYAQQFTRPADAAILLSSEALFAAIFAAIFLGERISSIGLFGCALIFSAILLVELGPTLWRSVKKSENLPAE